MRIMTLIATAGAAALLAGAAQAQSTAPNQDPASSEGTQLDQVHKNIDETTTTTVRTTTTTPTPAPAPEPMPATSAGTDVSATVTGEGATMTTTTVTMAPVPDTPENRAKYGAPESRAGKRTAAKGN